MPEERSLGERRAARSASPDTEGEAAGKAIEWGAVYAHPVEGKVRILSAYIPQIGTPIFP